MSNKNTHAKEKTCPYVLMSINLHTKENMSFCSYVLKTYTQRKIYLYILMSNKTSHTKETCPYVLMSNKNTHAKDICPYVLMS